MKRQKKGSREALLLVGPHETTKNHDTKMPKGNKKTPTRPCTLGMQILCSRGVP